CGPRNDLYGSNSAQRRRRPGASAQIYGRGNEKDGSNRPILAAEAGRREQEMKGCIQERSPGHWAIVLSVQDATGKRKRHWASFKGTKKEAQAERARLITEMQGGGAVNPSRITVAEFLDTFEKDCALHVSPASADRYHTALGHVRRHLGVLQLQKV